MKKECVGLLGKIFGHSFSYLEKVKVKKTGQIGTIVQHGQILYDYNVFINGKNKLFDRSEVDIFWEKDSCNRCGMAPEKCENSTNNSLEEKIYE